MGIEQLQRTDFVFSHHAGNPCQREFKFFRLGRGRQEESALRRTRLRRRGREVHFQNRRAWRMGFQIKLQKFQENFGIEHGDGEFDGAGEG